ncbi:hypothetical protein GCM10010210_24090 [Pseudonocardia hydrocarbonoxydans]|uniref:Uncharacterized protein n=1 Tax=Pseudonocardia hydrocarbonoxydans TaxID=76726 RepID=A0A4Y3WL34_9PSEU|nr:hypothetical protein PHY01_17680 [Pseudonocardia hydrocarbonoxydans]
MVGQRGDLGGQRGVVEEQVRAGPGGDVGARVRDVQHDGAALVTGWVRVHAGQLTTHEKGVRSRTPGWFAGRAPSHRAWRIPRAPG